MSIEDIIEKVTQICKNNKVEHLSLFGSFATGTATPTSDIDFVVYGCPDIIQLEDEIDEIETLRKIDIFDYNSIHNQFLYQSMQEKLPVAGSLYWRI